MTTGYQMLRKITISYADHDLVVEGHDAQTWLRTVDDALDSFPDCCFPVWTKVYKSVETSELHKISRSNQDPHKNLETKNTLSIEDQHLALYT